MQFFIGLILRLTGSPSEEIDSNAVKSSTSPLSNWDPMKEDFLSVKNTYAVNTDDLDIAFQGYRMYQSFINLACSVINSTS